jgi:hypothetical protein
MFRHQKAHSQLTSWCEQLPRGSAKEWMATECVQPQLGWRQLGSGGRYADNGGSVITPPSSKAPVTVPHHVTKLPSPLGGGEFLVQAYVHDMCQEERQGNTYERLLRCPCMWDTKRSLSPLNKRYNQQQLLKHHLHITTESTFNRKSSK